MMNASPRPAWHLSVLPLAFLAFGAGPAHAQEKSVRPGINKTYENPDVNESVRRFESENREVFSKRKEIVAACKLKPGMSVADIGAGTGLFTHLFAAEVGPSGRVYAVDIARKFIEHVETTSKEAGLKNVTGIVCTPTSTELPPDSVDLVFICDAYHHFEYPRKTMASAGRALRAGGQLILVDYRRIEGKTPDWLLKHLRAGQEVFTKEIEAAGFKVVDRADFLKENYFVRFEKAGSPPRVLVAYYSLTGNTEQMARGVAEGISRVPGVTAVVKPVSEVSKQDLEAADGIVLGSPTYYANIPGKMKVIIDDWSWKMKVDFTDKVGGAFSTGGGQVGGKEHVVTSLLLFMLSNRMIVAGPFYRNEKTGSVWGEPGSAAMTGPLDPGVSQQELDGARRLGERIAGLVKRLAAR
ncbi:MAG: methyltransferase domain-containing protein [Thermoguttaceae bacterium]|jgi:multimeric flavodoxin WrbA/ubiquinone/menaquinone biosynthesis C-methylase UbiE